MIALAAAAGPRVIKVLLAVGPGQPSGKQSNNIEKFPLVSLSTSGDILQEKLIELEVAGATGAGE